MEIHVIPAKAGIHLEPRLRRYKQQDFYLNDGSILMLAIASDGFPLLRE